MAFLNVLRAYHNVFFRFLKTVNLMVLYLSECMKVIGSNDISVSCPYMCC